MDIIYLQQNIENKLKIQKIMYNLKFLSND